MDAQLSANQFLAGEEYSIADIITWPWAFLIGRIIDESIWTSFPNLKRWINELHERPAILKGRKIGGELGKRKLNQQEEEARKELLFNQTNEKVRSAREEAAKSA